MCVEILEAEFQELYEECKESNWDGYNALPVNKDAIEMAKKVLQSFSALYIMRADLGAHPDGEVCLSFSDINGYEKSFMISVSPEGRLSYCGNVGDKFFNGEEMFDGTVSENIIDHIKNVYSIKDVE